MKPKSIYALVDPRDDFVYYIGKTVGSPKLRLKDHLVDGKNRDKVAWITSLSLDGLAPTLVILEQGYFTDDELNELEIDWIAAGREDGWPLVNIQIGGRNGAIINDCVRVSLSEAAKRAYAADPTIVQRARAKRLAAGGYHWSEESRAKISESLRKYWADPENTESLINALEKRPKHLSKEHRRKLSESGKGRVVSNETRKKLSQAKTGKPLSTEHKLKLSAAQQSRYEKMSDEQRKELTAAARTSTIGRVVTEETRDKIRKANLGRVSPMKGKTASKDTRRKMQEAHRARWAKLKEDGRYEEVCANIAIGTKRAIDQEKS